ncbi:MAG: carboxypeptidase-like regulatory domain-containing protein, partial [Blastocatellia bacterium]
MRVSSSKLSSTRLLTLFCAALFSTAQAEAQGTSGIRGLVTDPTGAVLPNAVVSVRHVGTNIERRLTTNSEGIYIADNIQPGEYEARVEATGFQRQLQRVTVLTGNTHTADFSLTVGSASETVVVTSEAPQINTSDYKMDQVITRERIE